MDPDERETSPTSLIHSSSSSSSSTKESRNEEETQLAEEEEEGEEDGQRKGDEGAAAAAAGDDDGYHTPTSPGHAIPETLECPPAPKKPSPAPYLRWWRMMRRSEARGEGDAERESGFDDSGGEIDDDFAPMAKKRRGEAAVGK
ncbi:hypothetical protein MUK42_19881 [Musa troglodytarum]|uniref:Uncharacterized protein n=1 Tax=Musa troglodytarum TaxID=320322 RepID=A0A9E7FRB1_9LILI|nr:hypothetical protein MUK42_19881 [Musa troglodytarum]